MTAFWLRGQPEIQQHLELTEYSKDLDFSPDEQLSAEPAGNALQVGWRLLHDLEIRLTKSHRTAEARYVKTHSGKKECQGTFNARKI